MSDEQPGSNLPIPDVQNARKIGDRLWFEYHCWESHMSADADLWYHSHQMVEVLGMAPCDGADIYLQEDRYYAACPLVYRIRFCDGHENEATEDELLDDVSEFSRPDPPRTADESHQVSDS